MFSLHKIFGFQSVGFQFLCVAILLNVLKSCALVKIESEQKPLGLQELDIRILTDNFARTALARVELAEDIISKPSTGDKNIQINAFNWKIQPLNL